MYEAAPTHGEDRSCTLLVTVAGFSDKWVDSDAAKKWATTIVRKAVSESYHTWEGDLSQVVPLNFTVAGKRSKLKFVGVPEALIADVVMPALKRLCPVKRLSTEEELAQRRPDSSRRRAQAIGDVDKAQSFMERLIEMRGDGGSDIKRRKFTEHVANVVERSQRLASSGMRQMKEDGRDTVE